MDCLVASFLAEAVILRERGVSSTLRLFVSITNTSEYWVARFRGSEYISDLILRSAPLARVSKDGRESLRCVHPSRRLLRKLLRMRSVSFTGSLAGDDDWECGVLVSIKHTFATSPRHAPEALMNLPPKEGVGNAGCPLHPRPRVHL